MSEAEQGQRELDTERVREIAEGINKALRDNFERGPNNRERVLENLNALGWIAGATIAGTEGGEAVAREFFLLAMDTTIGMLHERERQKQGNNSD
jgi:hypothetical protein